MEDITPFAIGSPRSGLILLIPPGCRTRRNAPGRGVRPACDVLPR